MVAIRALHKTHSNRLSTNYILHPIFYKCYTQDSKPPPPVDHRASYKLFQDAAQEDAEEEEAKSRPSKLTLLEDQSENWTGEESVRDAVLRMLVDKYKPLRSGPIRTADEKLKQAPPKVGSFPSLAPHPSPPLNDSSEQGGIRPSGAAMAKIPLLPSIEGHQPWHTTFHVPSHATSSIKYGHIPKPSSSPYPPLSQRPSALSTLDEQARRREREAKKRLEHAGRLSRARESTLDYKLGSKSGVVSSIQRRPNPVSLKGWASLVEDRIEKARIDGLFKNVKGRGQPIKQLTEEKNPFIAREEFLMNRIVQRNGAAPPWVEVQGELETAVSTFREIIKQSWTRRAIRMLTISQPPALLPKLTIADVTSLRDSDWETREKAFHDTALEEINSLVRKHNGLAPYAVRRPYYMRVAELEKVYRDSGEDILRGLSERTEPRSRSFTGSSDSDEGDAPVAHHPGMDTSLAPLRIRDVFRQWISAWRGGKQ